MSARNLIAEVAEAGTEGSPAGALAFVADAETRAVVEAAFLRAELGSIRVEDGNIRTAIERLGLERSPRLLIVDLEGSDMPLTDVDELAEVCEPGVSVIALGRRDEVGLFRSLLERGIADYIVKPVPVELLTTSLKRAVEGTGAARRTSRLGRTVAVLGVRGGVGATTVACGLAHIIANRHRRRVAVLDLDLHFGTVALAMDLDPVNGLRDAIEQVDGLDPLLVERLGNPVGEALAVFAAEIPPADPVSADPLAVEGVLDTLRHRFHYVVIDLPRYPVNTCLQVLERVDGLILVADQSLAAMRDTLRFSQLATRLNPAARSVVVVNRVGWAKAGEIGRSEFERGIGRQIDHLIPFDPALVAAAVNTGRLDYADKGQIASALAAVAASVTGRSTGDSGGLLRRLLRWLG